MRKTALSILCLLIPLCTAAQKGGLQPAMPKDVFKRNIHCSGSNYLAYPGPLQSVYTPAPAGKKPFHISHYGRHGSRYNNNQPEYDYAYNVLSQARRAGCLSPLGHDVLERVRRLRADAAGHLGELTPLGAQQHKDIARRMYENFPEVFQGDAVVNARSTVVIRCILSMENALQQLLVLNPALRVTHQASQRDMYYMNQQDPKMIRKRMVKAARDAFETYCDRRQRWQRLVYSLFTDSAYVRENVNGERLNYYLFNLASNIQSTELRKELTLYDIFTDDEILCNWQRENVNWFLAYGNFPPNGGQQPFIQRNLLRTIIHQADSCIALERPGAMLRYGHETIVMPLTCLLGINGYDQPINNLELLERRGWINYQVFPMACNIQFVFYRSSPDDDDVLFKVLLNENEATLPLPTDTPPYYRWADFRRHYTQLLDSYQ